MWAIISTESARFASIHSTFGFSLLRLAEETSEVDDQDRCACQAECLTEFEKKQQ
jgi:hypothetical protein